MNKAVKQDFRKDANGYIHPDDIPRLIAAIEANNNPRPKKPPPKDRRK